jgi:hypothetical protein
LLSVQYGNITCHYDYTTWVHSHKGCVRHVCLCVSHDTCLPREIRKQDIEVAVAGGRIPMARRSSGHGSLYRIPGLSTLRAAPLDVPPESQTWAPTTAQQQGVTGRREVLHPQCNPGYDLVPLARVSQDSLPPWQFVNQCSLNPEAVGTSVIPAEEMVSRTARWSSNTCSSPSRMRTQHLDSGLATPHLEW